MSDLPTSTQATQIINKLGNGDAKAGAAILAEITGVHPTRVYRWTLPKDRDGTGGIIPAQHHQTILDGARERRITLGPEDFFENPEGVAASRALSDEESVLLGAAAILDPGAAHPTLSPEPIGDSSSRQAQPRRRFLRTHDRSQARGNS